MSSERWVLEVGREEDAQLTEALGTGLTESARATGNTFVRRELWVAARNDSGQLLGGLTGQFQFAWLYVARLWVGADHRGLGIGRALMHEAERQAVEEKCLGVHLQTYGFQARGFYEQLGYRVFAEIEDDAPDRTRYFLRRNLRTSAWPEKCRPTTEDAEFAEFSAVKTDTKKAGCVHWHTRENVARSFLCRSLCALGVLCGE